MKSIEQASASAAHWTAKHYEALFLPEAPERMMFVALEDSDESTLTGLLIARCLPDEWEIENVVVAEGCRRKGIARALVQELIAHARSASVSSIILEVRKSNLAAARLYENIGFTEEGRRKDYYQNPSEDSRLYRFPLQFCDKIC